MSHIPTEKAVELALEQHRAGHFQRAQEMYMAILRSDPGNVDAIHLLGVLANQGKKPDVAVELIERAIRARPNEAVFHYNYADSLAQLGRMQDAAAAYRRATELNADYYEAWHNLSHVLTTLGRYDEAIEAATEAYELADEPSSACNNLGNAYRGAGRMDEAIEAYHEALEVRPEFPEAENNLGLALAQSGQLEESIPHYRKAIALSPTFADPYNNLGVAFLRMARQEEAAEVLDVALKLRPDYLEAMNNLGVALRDSGRPEEAVSWFERVVEKNPDSPEIHNNLSTAYRDIARLDKALEHGQRAVELQPDFPAAYFSISSTYYALNLIDEAIEAGRMALEQAPDNPTALCGLGYKLIERGDVEEGIDLVRQSLVINPDPQAFSNALLAINYVENYTPEQVFQLHREWGKMEQGLREADVTFERDLDPHRRLRVAYISPDLRRHSVFTFVEPIFANHDKEQFEIVAYSSVVRPDSKTMQARIYADEWREVVGFSPEKLIETIRGDRIDILVELAGHTSGNSLKALARRAAPIQVSAIGYPCTTGLPSIDYRISDGYCDPVGMTEAFNTETLMRIEPSFWCYRPPEDAPAVAPLPADKNGFITFATVNNFAKVTPRVQDLWAQIVAAVPNSRFILQTVGTGSAVARERILERFARNGVSADRLDLRGHTPFREFLELFGEVDIVLDPFPFNGGTTTCHNLWMGAPCVSLAGGAHVGRMGVSLLNNVGLGDLVAQSTAEYLDIAVSLANDLPRLREIRSTLRPRMQESALRDEVGYTRKLEAAYREMWARYSAQARP